MTSKLIALDLDGTTLNNQSKVSPKTNSIIQKLSQRGFLICIITGRPYRLVKNIYQKLNLKTPIIIFNGNSGIIPNQKWAGSYQYTISRNVVLDLLKHKDQLGIKIMSAESATSMLGSQNASPAFAAATVDFFPDNLTPQEILSPRTLTSNPIEVAIHYDDNQFTKISSYVQRNYDNTVELSKWGGPHSVVEVTTKGINKATGLTALMNYYHLHPQDVYAFGDQINDLPTLKIAGHAIAMKNAVPEVKAIADEVTQFDNEHDGVARYLEQTFKI